NKEKDDYKKENEILKRKLEEFEKLERGKPLSARSSDDSSNKELLRTIADLKGKCKDYQNELEQTNENLDKIRREREEYRKKFDQAKKELEDMQNELDKQTKLNKGGRSSPALKRDEDQQHRDSISLSTMRVKRPQSPSVGNRTPRSPPSFIRLDSNSSEEPTKIDSKPSTPTRKSSEPIGLRTSSTSTLNTSLNAKRPTTPVKSSTKNVHANNWTTADDHRVKNFREKHAATVIQREWRRHEKSHKDPLRDINKARHENLDKWSSKISASTKSYEAQSPRSNSKVDNVDSNSIKSRPPSASATANETALKTVQAALRGYLNRSEIDKIRSTTSSPTPKSRSPVLIERSERAESDDDDYPSLTRSKPSQSVYGSEKKQDTPHDQSKSSTKQSLFNDKIQPDSRSPSSARDLASKMRQSPSPPPVSHRSSTPLASDKLGSINRFPISDKDSFSKSQRPFSPSNTRRPISPSASDRPSSRHISPDNTRPPPRTSPVLSKQTIKETKNDSDDDDVVVG
ncbi:unnamed protein product, partial [Rotaria sp. Silwood2]